jgi:hypothetical protein
MTIGTSELIAIITLLIGFVAWVNSTFVAIDKRFDNMKTDINGLGTRLTVFEEGTAELLEQKINLLRATIFDLEKKLGERGASRNE